MNVLAIFAHPDDEVLGAGGTLAKHAEAGDNVQPLLLAIRGLENEAAAASIALGTNATGFRNLPDQLFDTIPFNRITESVTDYYDPDVVYTHHPGDLNLDHALTARAVLTAFRPKPGEKPRTILACEIGSSTEWTFPQVFQPNWFEELTSFQLDKKVAAMECYPSEVQDAPHPRSYDGISTAAQWRGQQAGVNWAEAFQLLRRTC